MKQLPIKFGGNESDSFTQIKRNDKAALYRRETPEGAFVSFDVFAIRSKDGMEIYPNDTACSRWSWSPIKEDRANTYFDRITAGDIVIPNIDPITGDVIVNAEEKSLDELPDVNVENSTPIEIATLPIEDVSVEVPVVELPVEVVVVAETPILLDDPTTPVVVELPEVEIPTDVQTTADGGAVVTVAKVRKNKVYSTMIVPVGEFHRDDFAKANNLKPANSESYGALMREIKLGNVTELRKEKVGKGRPRSVYTAVVKTVAAV